MIKIRIHNLLKKGTQFQNFNLLPFASLFWDDELMALNLGLGNWCLQINVINFIQIMEQKKKELPPHTPGYLEQKRKNKAQVFFGRLLVLAFGMCWLMIIFKTFGIGFMKSLSWGTVLLPLFFFLITSLSYIILLYCYVKWFKMKEYGLTEEQIRLVKRCGHLHKKPTRIKDGFVKIIILLIAAVIAALILH